MAIIVVSKTLPKPNDHVNEFWTLDECAECLPVSAATSMELWAVHGMLAEKRAKMKPLGGDGSDGTVEFPEARDDCDNNIKNAWKYLSEDACIDLNTAFAKEFKG